ncbi:hypothetical protein BFT35_02670 [Thermoanaerobacterium thermosaccharolyticum]|uniref:hypothetical protein n=1 Tax=Thermoanaerobacterium thermosaccharolyticum TaxID=1517 RepID=UPI000C09BC58|nr:hypothetical protein [Thermoanaerobacterium thermosaccharolyticum]PHO07975.1 hypothetical protein BFT35_02670 [Thermoanaerobacterium thermosaccharolyticum]
MSIKIKRKIIIILIASIIITSLVLFFISAHKMKVNYTNLSPNTLQLRQQDEEKFFLNNVQVSNLSIQRCQMEVSDKVEQGLNFIVTYTLPKINNAIKNHKIGFQIIYPKKYADLIGSNMTPIAYVYPNNNNNQTMSSAFSIYMPGISDDELDKLIKEQNDFTIYIYIDQLKKKEITVHNDITN